MKTLTFNTISETDFYLLISLLDRLAVDYFYEEKETATVSPICEEMTVSEVLTMLENDEQTTEISFEEHLNEMKQWKTSLTK